MEQIKLTIVIEYDGPILPNEVDGIAERLQEQITGAIESGLLRTKHAEPSDYTFDYEAS